MQVWDEYAAWTEMTRRVYVGFSSSISNAITGLGRPLGLQEVEAVRFLDNRHMNVVRLSALCTGRLYPLGTIPGTHFC